MGCKAITPHLVGLAKRLEGKAFHLVASHCQRDTRANAVAYLRSRGLRTATPNFSVQSFGHHPKVKGNGYVPYYMVFDHNGDLAQHHMCGAYHGGDGLAMIEWVDKLLKQVPTVLVGKEPYRDKAVARLAAQVAKGKGVGKALATIEKRLESLSASDAAHGDATRLRAAILADFERRLHEVAALRKRAPGRVASALAAARALYAGSEFAARVKRESAALAKSEAHKRALRLEQRFTKAIERFEKARKKTPKLRAATKRALEKLLADEADAALPYAAIVRAARDDLR